MANLQTENRFWSKVKIVGDLTSCWEWQAFCYPTGHGQFHLEKYDVKASRAVWILIHGPIKTEDYICHRCDNPRCVRPTHLYKGTHATNQADKRGKFNYRHENAPYVKLSWVMADKIRALNLPAPTERKNIRGHLPKGMYSQTEVARMFGISPTTVKRIWNGTEYGGWRREVPLNGQPSVDNQS